MPVLERVSSASPAAPSLDMPAPVSLPVRTCSGCFLTESELRETGLMGCARCYETFAPLMAVAAEKLHGVRVPHDWIQEGSGLPVPRRPIASVTNPWPTRRAVPHGG